MENSPKENLASCADLEEDPDSQAKVSTVLNDLAKEWASLGAGNEKSTGCYRRHPGGRSDETCSEPDFASGDITQYF